MTLMSKVVTTEAIRLKSVVHSEEWIMVYLTNAEE